MIFDCLPHHCNMQSIFPVLQERKFRKRVDADGGVGGVRDARLSEVLAASLRSQQAVRRAIRGVS